MVKLAKVEDVVTELHKKFYTIWMELLNEGDDINAAKVKQFADKWFGNMDIWDEAFLVGERQRKELK